MNTRANQNEKISIQLLNRNCSVCGSKRHTLVYDQPTENITGVGDIGYHHLINICTDCGFVFASPTLNETDILKYYEKMSNYEHPESTGVRPNEDIKQIERQVNIITSRFPSGFKGTALDIGCSIAYGLSLLQKSGWDVIGLDPSDKCIEISKNILGVSVLKGFFEGHLLEDKKPFDVIILSHVVEHLLFPNIIMKQVRELLSDNGIIYIEVPNLMMPNNTKCYFGFEHVNFFTPQSLINLATQNGFEVDSIETYENGKDIHPFYPVIALTIKKSNQQIKFISDRDDAIKAIENYKSSSSELLTKINARISNILSKTKPEKLALWGAGIHTSQLLSETELKYSKIKYIFDNDPKKSGSLISGIEIRMFPENAEDIAGEIEAILISSEASEDTIYKQIKFLERRGIIIYLLYGDK